MTPTKINTSLKKRTNIFWNKSLFIDSFLTIVIIFIMLIIVKSPKRYSEGTISGLKLFFNSVLPGLFPFMLLTKLLTELGIAFKVSSKLGKISNKVFGTPGVSFFAFFMSIISGYPIGAKIISDLYEKHLISSSDAKKMSVFCTTSGPIFIIGAVGTIMLNSYKAGIVLYLSHIFSSIFLGFFYNLLTRKKTSTQTITTNRTFLTNQKQDNLLTYCLTQTINNLFVVGAYITTFFLITELLENIGVISSLTFCINKILAILHLPNTYTKGVLFGLLEITRGAKELSLISSNASLVLISGLLSFSGLSIIFQSMAFLKTTQIKMHEFVFFKFMHMLLSMIFCYIILIIA